jgi:hypothetical protein
MATIYVEPPLAELATAAELSEIRRAEAEERLKELQVMVGALASRSARKDFWKQYGEEVVALSAVETDKGTKWIHEFLP